MRDRKMEREERKQGDTVEGGKEQDGGGGGRERRTKVKMCKLLGNSLFKTTSGGFKLVLGLAGPCGLCGLITILTGWETTLFSTSAL